MARLIFTTIASLDGYIADENGNFDWAEPDEAVHAFVNDLERPIGTYLYGRGMYETMLYWETATEGPAVEVDFAEVWRAADKVVYSTKLAAPASARTRIERAFEPDAVRDLVVRSDHDVSVSGPGLAGSAFRAGLVDEIRLFQSPVVIGRGKRALPGDVRLDLELIDERRFENGVVYLAYRVRSVAE